MRETLCCSVSVAGKKVYPNTTPNAKKRWKRSRSFGICFRVGRVFAFVLAALTVEMKKMCGEKKEDVLQGFFTENVRQLLLIQTSEMGMDVFITLHHSSLLFRWHLFYFTAWVHFSGIWPVHHAFPWPAQTQSLNLSILAPNTWANSSASPCAPQ